MAREVCEGRFVLICSSGYDLQVLPWDWLALISGVLDLEDPEFSEPYRIPEEPLGIEEKVERVVAEVKVTYGNYWKSLR